MNNSVVIMKLRSWLLLAVLAVFVSFAAGIRQGMNVEKQNLAWQQSQERAFTKTTSSTTAQFLEVEDKRCGVQYLLPKTIASESGKILILCDREVSTNTAKLQQQGYTRVAIASDSAMVDIWVKTPKEVDLLIQRTVRAISEVKR